jgi:uncharacterized protein YjbI with pentapeptide repeats
MANEEHLKILKQGVEVWNRWRKENPKVRRPDLSGADLFREPLIEADLFRADLSGADLFMANLFMAHLSEAHLSGADLFRANLFKADLREAHLNGAHLREADLSGARLRKADLSGADLFRADLSGADLFRADLTGADLIGADLIRADLREARLIEAHLSGADLSGARLIEAHLSAADLSGADLFRADLSRADLSGADLSGAMVAYTLFADIDLSVVKGLETITHDGSSTIGVDTIYRSKGRIPEAFLRGVGIPDNFITYFTSLTGEAMQYYSCFISYSSQDEAFAQRLHNDLQGQGVRCWFAPEDMKIGDKIRFRVDESIRVYDKLLLILSESSIASEWVEHEVEHALDLERERGQMVLFPVRLDEAVMGAKVGWAGSIRRSRHIGDFCQWKEHDAYQAAFDRLLRDLKAEDK